MSGSRFGARGLATMVVAAAVLTLGALDRRQPAAGVVPTATPYHEGQPSPIATPHAMIPTLYPLPGPADPASSETMATGGAAMVQAADDMDRAARLMIASDVPALVDRGRHWELDARALRDRGAWMVLSASAESMVHDPATAAELNLESLRGNGLSMAAEGRAMVEHGQTMATEVERLRRDGVLDDALAGELAADATALVATGEVLERDGERMREDAEKLLESIGR